MDPMNNPEDKNLNQAPNFADPYQAQNPGVTQGSGVPQNPSVPQSPNVPQNLDVSQNLNTPQNFGVQQDFDASQNSGVAQEYGGGQGANMMQNSNMPQNPNVLQNPNMPQQDPNVVQNLGKKDNKKIWMIVGGVVLLVLAIALVVMLILGNSGGGTGGSTSGGNSSNGSSNGDNIDDGDSNNGSGSDDVERENNAGGDEYSGSDVDLSCIVTASDGDVKLTQYIDVIFNYTDEEQVTYAGKVFGKILAEYPQDVTDSQYKSFIEGLESSGCLFEECTDSHLELSRTNLGWNTILDRRGDTLELTFYNYDGTGQTADSTYKEAYKASLESEGFVCN